MAATTVRAEFAIVHVIGPMAGGAAAGGSLHER